MGENPVTGSIAREARLDISLPVFLSAAIAAALVGVSKSGFGGIGVVAAVPITTLAMPPETALGLLLPVLLFGDLIAVSSHRAAFDRAAVLGAVPGAALGVVAGGLLLALIDGAPITALVGLIAILFALHSMRGNVVPDGASRLGEPRLAPLAGLASGITSTLAHAGGPPIHIHLLARGYSPLVFVATSSVFMATVNLMKIVPYALLGNFDASTIAFSVTLAPFAAAGSWGGVRLARRIERRTFARVVNGLMLLVGTKLLYDGVRGVLA